MFALNAIPNSLSLPAELCPPEIASDVIYMCWQEIIQGDDDFSYLITEEFEEFTDEQAEQIAEIIVQARLQQQASFGEVTTNLARAFAQLEQQQVLTDQMCEHTVQEGHAELTAAAQETPDTWQGIAFIPGFSVQNFAEKAAEFTEAQVQAHAPTPETFVLGFATVLSPEETTLPDAEADALFMQRSAELMKNSIIPTLERYGISVEWSGDVEDLAILHNAEFYEPI